MLLQHISSAVLDFVRKLLYGQSRSQSGKRRLAIARASRRDSSRLNVYLLYVWFVKVALY
jgi:hypothetical protein